MTAADFFLADAGISAADFFLAVTGTSAADFFLANTGAKEYSLYNRIMSGGNTK